MLLNPAMRMGCLQFLAAGTDVRAAERRGYAEGTRPELIDTPAGTASLGCARDRPGPTSGTTRKRWPQALLEPSYG